jgi:hypothetical protein
LEQTNIALDALRQGLKFSSDVDPAAEVTGKTYDEMFEYYGKQGDANNRKIEQMLAEAAAVQTGPSESRGVSNV